MEQPTFKLACVECLLHSRHFSGIYTLRPIISMIKKKKIQAHRGKTTCQKCRAKIWTLFCLRLNVINEVMLVFHLLGPIF